MIMQVNFTTLSFEEKSRETVKAIRQHLKENKPANLVVHLTGPAGIGADLATTVEESIDRTTLTTIILVIILLLLIYRSPVAFLLPLATITVAFLISRGIVGFLAQAGWKISSTIDSFLIVLSFGIGTDYCLFIISRLKEEMARGNSPDKASLITVNKIGAVITASAATVIIGFLGLATASFGMLKTIGPVLAIAISVTLLASLTFTPALASILGAKLFWPFSVVERPRQALFFNWSRITDFVTNKAKIIVPLLIFLLLIPYLKLPQLKTSFDLLAEIPKDKDSVMGFEILKNHFSQGEMMPLVVIINSPEKDLKAYFSTLERAISKISQIEGVAKIESIIAPDGKLSNSPFLVKNQLKGLRAQLSQVKELILPGINTELKPAFLADFSETFRDYLTELGDTYPEIKEHPAYKQSFALLATLSFQQNGGQPPQTFTFPPVALTRLKDAMKRLEVNLGELENVFSRKPHAYFYPQSLVAKNEQLQKLTAFYFSKDKKTLRFHVILKEDPYSPQAFQVVHKLRECLGQNFDGRFEKYVGGQTAEFADIREVIDKDFNKVMVMVMAGVLLVLIVLLKSLVAPLYLLATVLLSYGTTLGIVTWLFQDVFGQGGLSYAIPILIFVLLITLGEDYNIFLSSRFREESEKMEVKQGVREAARKTGGTITACGIILAGTFAALTTSPLQTLFQIGCSVAIGILIDTFLVRAILVPAIAYLLGKWNWWPGKVKFSEK
jgi:RND superfamily putative drug exporter